MGRVRVLRQPLALLLGPAAAPGVHPAGPARRLRPDRRQGRRARGAGRYVHRWPGPGHRPARLSSATRTTTAPPSKRPWPARGSGCCGPPARASLPGPSRTCSSPCARSSNQSTTPSKASSTWNNTAATLQVARLSCDRSWLTTIDLGIDHLEAAPDPVRVRAAFVSDDDIRDMTAAYACGL